MMGYLRVILLAIIVIAELNLAEEVTVKTAKGNVRGIRVDSEEGFYYYSFRGIRYAQAPIDNLRFRDPVEVEPFTEDYDATEDGLVCPQYDIASSGPVGDEDCLNLNVYTPRLDNKKRPVMVYIHGGAFIMGGGSSYNFGPAFLIPHDVVVVTFNYRLGPLGFLATSDKAATGNFGIKDQIMVLKWVQKNIATFGGDPNKVTIFGEDAGAASVSIHAMSPESKGLFHGAIAMSGNALCDQFFRENPQESAVELAARLQCTSEKGEDIVECLRRQTQQEIVTNASKMFTFFSYPRWWAPSIDGVVLPETPEKLMAEGKFQKVPFIVGQTKDEGAFYFRLTLNTFNMGSYDDNFIDHKLPRLLPVISKFASKLYPITRQVRKKYFVNTDMENEDEFRTKYVEFLTDMLFTRCVNKFANILADAAVPTYYYSFDYRGQYSIVNLQGEQTDMGVAHGDDIQYIWSGIWGEDLTMSTSDIKFSKNVFTSLLTNFAKTSVPTPSVTEHINETWTPLAPGKNNVLRIGDKLKMENDHKKDVIAFWNEDIPKLFRKKKSTKKAKDEL